MNFLFISTFFPPWNFGGDGIYLEQMANLLADEGHEVDIIHCRDSYRILGGPLRRDPNPTRPGVRIHSLSSRWGLLSPLITQQTGLPWMKSGAIRAILNTRRFDAVHFHNISLFGPGVLSLIPATEPTIRLYTTHEHWLICPMHVLWKFNSRACESPDCLRCSIQGGIPPQLWRYSSLIGNNARHVDQFIAPSRFTAAIHAERGFQERFEVLPNFVPRPKESVSAARKDETGRPYFLFAGRLETIKGLQTVIPLWKRVPSADLIVVGEGTQATHLRSLAAENPRIRFLGHLSQDQLDPWFRGAVATLIPSLCYEVFPLVCIESMARKTPVLARDLGSLTEIVQESGGGLLYKSDEDFLSAIQELLASQERRDLLGGKGYRQYESSWTPESHLAGYQRILRETSLRRNGKVLWKE